ncbi:transposase [Acidithiobacillus thiooxidans]|uniref:transposase n=1 Tax=Acidithiobacillus TaxID=119977 RepID=UPI000AF09112|nr:MULTISPECIES: transposase [Acidithiobacillus]MBE7567583.1 transposase [Acidithiobacillus sp. HP-11]MBU2749537.1 transposase [Acidithiobacillus thiooxidans]MBU2793880.1 transposase [Acidithiobacillus thiooxidans]MBU2837594.1 transposase [Acidithiobacillus thiooxidans]MBU2839802.1 transposase [Acidithiobacillus thiooxidans]
MPPTEAIVTLQALVQRLDDLLGMQNMENNRLEMAEPAARASIEALLLTIHQQMDTVRRQIQDHMDDHLHSTKQVDAYAGLNPHIRESGQWVCSSHIAKAGYVFLRKALYLPAVVAKRYNPVIAAFFDRLRAKCPMQVIIAAMRKLLRIAYGVLKSGQPCEPEEGLA